MRTWEQEEQPDTDQEMQQRCGDFEARAKGLTAKAQGVQQNRRARAHCATTPPDPFASDHLTAKAQGVQQASTAEGERSWVRSGGRK